MLEKNSELLTLIQSNNSHFYVTLFFKCKPLVHHMHTLPIYYSDASEKVGHSYPVSGDQFLIEKMLLFVVNLDFHTPRE